MKCVNPEARDKMVAPGDEKLPAAEQTVFHMTQLTQEEQVFLTDIQGTGSRIEFALHLGLASVDNFIGPDGKVVKLERDRTKREIVGDKKPWLQEQLVLIPFGIQDKVAGRILRGVGLTETEAKNS